MTTPIAAAAIQALAAYGGPQRAEARDVGGERFAAPQRETVRRGMGVTVELSAEAQATLIAVQSAASGASLLEEPRAAARPAGPVTPIERPGSRLNLTI